jgi:hypothetical protein
MHNEHLIPTSLKTAKSGSSLVVKFSCQMSASSLHLAAMRGGVSFAVEPCSSRESR